MKHTDQLDCECGPKSGDSWDHEGSYHDTLPNYWTTLMPVRLYKMACTAPWSPRKETNPGGLPHWENVRALCPENAIHGDVPLMREYCFLHHGNAVYNEVRQGLASLGFKLQYFEQIPLTLWASFFSSVESNNILESTAGINFCQCMEQPVMLSVLY